MAPNGGPTTGESDMRRKFASVLAATVLATGLGAATAPSASAASGCWQDGNRY